MYKLSPYLNSTMLKNINYSLIYSHISYAIQVWGTAGKNEIDKILVLQKSAIKLMARRPVSLDPLTNPMFFSWKYLK